MKKLLYLFFLVSIFNFSQVKNVKAQVNGEEFDVDGISVVHVWGTHAEMGYAHGYLLSSDIMRIVREYMFSVISPEDYKTTVLPVFRMWIHIPENFQQELDGMLLGIADGGSSIYVEELERDLTSEDLAVMNSIVDFWVFIDKNPGYDLACSSTCGWGDGTSNDPDSPGGTLHCRDMDWTDTSNYLLGKSSRIIAFESSDPNEQPWISIAYPGYIGCLSGMNANGTGSTLNLGNHVETPGSTSGNVPICMQVRSALERTDPNGDGYHNAMDVWSVLKNQSRIPSTIVHTFGKAQGEFALEPPAFVVESNHTGIIRRHSSDEPDLDPWFIAATNHHRKLYSPAPCWRYSTIIDEITEDDRIDSSEIWQIETDVSVQTTMHTMLFRPDIMDLYLSVSINSTPAPYNTPSYLQWNQMFTPPGTPTITPTPSPTPTNTLTPYITFTPTPQEDTPTPTPQEDTPTPTPTVFEEFYYDIQLNRTVFTGGDLFLLQRRLDIPESVSNTLECIILEFAQQYWFWPEWTQDFQGNIRAFEPGTYGATVLEFTWPDNVDGSGAGLRFWAALLTNDTFELLTNVDFVEFSYQ